MATLQLQTFLDGAWRDAATLTLNSPDHGIGSPATLDYDLDYFTEAAAVAALNRPVRDLRAVSVRFPVDLAPHASERWLPFVLDLIPQGTMRRRLAAEKGWRDDDPRLDYQLLLRGAGSPIGNVRVLEARQADEALMLSANIPGVTLDQILGLDETFMDVWSKAGLTAGGSEGVQGEWPKILMTKAANGVWFPDPLVADEDAVDHVLVKRSRRTLEHSDAILRSEPGYLKLARAFGLRAEARLRPGNRVIVIPRFDRVIKDGKVIRLGQESLASAVGASEFGASIPHTKYIATIRRYATDFQKEIMEYVLRDVLNLAAGNPDNHGRNTALQKFPDGRIALTPVFDFAPMAFLQEGPRVTRWADVTNDSAPDWVRVAEAVSSRGLDPAVMLSELKSRESFIRNLPDHARAVGIEDETIGRAMRRHREIADTLAAIPEQRTRR